MGVVEAEGQVGAPTGGGNRSVHRTVGCPGRRSNRVSEIVQLCVNTSADNGNLLWSTCADGETLTR